MSRLWLPSIGHIIHSGEFLEKRFIKAGSARFRVTLRVYRLLAKDSFALRGHYWFLHNVFFVFFVYHRREALALLANDGIDKFVLLRVHKSFFRSGRLLLGCVASDFFVIVLAHLLFLLLALLALKEELLFHFEFLLLPILVLMIAQHCHLTWRRARRD